MFTRLFVGLVICLGMASCINRNITYVQLPTSTEVVDARGLQKTQTLSPTTKLVVEGTTEIVPTTNPDPKIDKAPPEVHDEKIAIPDGYCPRYRLPRLPTAPIAPLDKLQALTPGDTVAIDALTRTHIVELHEWIDNTQAILNKSYYDYVLSCDKLHKQKSNVKKTG